MKSDIRRVARVAFSLLSQEDRRKVYSVSVIQTFLALLDLMGVALVGLVSTISFLGIQSKPFPSQIDSFLKLLKMNEFTLQSQVAVIGIAVSFLFIFKSLSSALITRKFLYFLNLRSALVSAELLLSLMKKPYDFIKSSSPPQLLYSLTRGVDSLIAGIISALIIVFGEIVLLVIMTVGLFIFDPVITIFSSIYFVFIWFILAKRFNNQSQILQSSSVNEAIKSEKRILESITLYREFMTRNATPEQINLVEVDRRNMASLRARVNFLPYITKYTMEISLILGTLILMAIQLVLKDSLTAISTLSIFLAAASRVSPSILRLQQSILFVKSNLGETQKTIELLECLSKLENANVFSGGLKNIPDGELKGDITVDSLSFRYAKSGEFNLKDVTFKVSEGEMLAIVGPSGGGKSTLVDLMLGALIPDSGSVLISNRSPGEFIASRPGGLGFVAQESIFFDETLRANLLIGLDSENFSDELLWSTLQSVGLSQSSHLFSQGLDTYLGDRGLNLSVGQRQRLSIARALLTKPKVIFFDEPTSSLDVETENLILELIESLRGETTIILIAHRLKTVRKADKVLYIENGMIKKYGNFEEVIAIEYKANAVDELA